MFSQWCCSKCEYAGNFHSWRIYSECPEKHLTDLFLEIRLENFLAIKASQNCRLEIRTMHMSDCTSNRIIHIIAHRSVLSLTQTSFLHDIFSTRNETCFFIFRYFVPSKKNQYDDVNQNHEPSSRRIHIRELVNWNISYYRIDHP